MESSVPPIWILAAIGVLLFLLVGFALFVVALLLWLSARASGWTALAKQYAAEDPPAGQEFAWQTVRVGIVRYRHGVKVIVAPQGLWLSMRLKVGKFPPLFIPWGEIKGTEKTRLYSRKAVRLSIGEPSAATIVVYAKLFETMSPYLGPGF